MWILPETVEGIFTRLGFSIAFHEGARRDTWFSAKLVDPSRTGEWLQRAGASL